MSEIYDFRGWRVTWAPISTRDERHVRIPMLQMEPHRFVNQVSAYALGLIDKHAPIGAHYLCVTTLQTQDGRCWDEFNPIRLGRVGGPDTRSEDDELRPAPQYWLGRKRRMAKAYTGGQWKMPPLRKPMPTACNDNVAPVWEPGSFPVWVNTIPTQAARRAWLDSLPTWEESGLTGTRIARNLKKTAPNAFRQLMLVSALLEPLHLVAANDNYAVDGDNEIADGFGHERVQSQSSIRPSIPSMLQAFADAYRPRVVVSMRGEIQRFGGDGQTCRRGIVEIGGLRFFEGKLDRVYQNGKWRKPWVDTTRPAVDKPLKGSATEAHMEDRPSVPHRYLDRIGAAEWAGSGPMPQQMCGPRGVALTAIPAVKAEMRRDLAKQCEGFRVTRCPPGTAWHYGLLSGVSYVKGTQDGITTKPAMQALHEISRAPRRQEVEQLAGRAAIETIEGALADESYTSIGRRMGYEDSSAHQSGKRAVIRTLEIICKKIAA